MGGEKQKNGERYRRQRQRKWEEEGINTGGGAGGEVGVGGANRGRITECTVCSNNNGYL